MTRAQLSSRIRAGLGGASASADGAFRRICDPLADFTSRSTILRATTLKAGKESDGYRMLHRFPKVMIHLAGEMQISLGHLSRRMRCGDVLLVPPGVGYLERPGARRPTNFIAMATESGVYAHVMRWSGEPRAVPMFQVTLESAVAGHLAHVLELLVSLPEDRQQVRVPLLNSFLRLLPDEISSRHVIRRQVPIPVQAAQEYILEHLSDPQLTITNLSAMLGMDRSNFSRLFHRHVGDSPQQYLIKNRMRTAQNLLVSTRLTTNEIACAAGFSHPAQFSRMFGKYVGTTPVQYRKHESDGGGQPFLRE